MENRSSTSRNIDRLTAEQADRLYDLLRIAFPCEDGIPVEAIIEEDA
ncbi:hypothetical protein J6TS7_66520 [Paenibacillus dendritiformis]|nr:hypothetical protein J6TS7_66520 [Paenibacillus dendritiformis]